jgi:hypothetical protein
MTERPQYDPTPDHMAAFGSIVQHFARHEYLMQTLARSLVHAPELSNIALLTSGLGYSGKRDAILSLLRDVQLPPRQKERIKWFLGELHKHNQLRNHVAHSIWKAGTRPHSIKPIGADARGGLARFIGLDPKEKDWLLDELLHIANELGKNHDRFVDYLASVSLMPPPAMAENTEQSNSLTSSSEGRPSAR